MKWKYPTREQLLIMKYKQLLIVLNLVLDKNKMYHFHLKTAFLQKETIKNLHKIKKQNVNK